MEGRFVMTMQIMDFYLDNVSSVHDFWGSSVQPSHEARNRYPRVQLTAVNLANFLLTRFVPDDYVVVKMDVEAAGAGRLSHADVRCNTACCLPAPSLLPCRHARNTNATLRCNQELIEPHDADQSWRCPMQSDAGCSHAQPAVEGRPEAVASAGPAVQTALDSREERS